MTNDRCAAIGRRWLVFIAVIACVLVARSGFAQVLETETARLRVQGAVQAGTNVEVQTATEGHEWALPMLFEYGITNRWELVVEPVARTWIRPHVTPRATGLGDTEITLEYLARMESGAWPAIALAGEVKAPTARNTLIGTGQRDVAAYLIASKRFGHVDTHVNVTYTWVGQPPGTTLSNIWGTAFAAMYTPASRLRLYGEVLTTMSATGQAEQTTVFGPAPIVAEAATQELVGTIGAGVYVRPRWFLSVGVSYDNTAAWLIRPGITFRSK
jgi:hypothetical protein